MSSLFRFVGIVTFDLTSFLVGNQKMTMFHRTVPNSRGTSQSSQVDRVSQLIDTQRRRFRHFANSGAHLKSNIINNRVSSYKTLKPFTIFLRRIILTLHSKHQKNVIMMMMPKD
uniref:Uncharacterized protein n=1 Tax=Cacopsylla melanoneura TaxID=428564 RepID=A0A8D8TQU3_9HEMI